MTRGGASTSDAQDGGVRTKDDNGDIPKLYCRAGPICWSAVKLVACTWRYSFSSEHTSQDITRGVNLACSTSPMHCSQAHFRGALSLWQW